ncbi:hypothetical protein [Streptomyces sp. NPDC001787]|uniref:hypothetical protein n=1 Tax=Streptomyces sp. NPDC001787 TaxID=3154523 RepID=UPI00332AED96
MGEQPDVIRRMNASAAGERPATVTYDGIGAGHQQVRKPAPRLIALIRKAMAGARTVVNDGSGTRFYELNRKFVEYRQRLLPAGSGESLRGIGG